jgi:Histone methylation protein DOT1
MRHQGQARSRAAAARQQRADGVGPAGHEVRPQQSWGATNVREEGIKVFPGWLDLNGPLFGPVLYLFEYVRSYLEERAEAFDTRFGTDTAAPFFGRNQKPATHFYTATTASLIYEILNSIPLPSNTFAFVDMGSGKGRALLVASEFPFRKIVGVELSPHLHRIAEENLKLYRPASQQCTAFQLQCMNVVDYVYDQEPVVLFLADPFGRETVEKVVANLEASLGATPREALVVYIYPQFEDVLRRSHFFRKEREGGPRWRPWNRYVVYAALAAEAR